MLGKLQKPLKKLANLNIQLLNSSKLPGSLLFQRSQSTDNTGGKFGHNSAIVSQGNETEGKPLQTPTLDSSEALFVSTFNSRIFVQNSISLHLFDRFF